MAQRLRVLPITTDSSGNAALFLNGAIGTVVAVGYVKGTLAATVDITMTDSDTGAPVLTITNGAASAIYRPHVLINDVTGATVAANYVPVSVGGRVTVTVAQGGASAAGTLVFILDGDLLA